MWIYAYMHVLSQTISETKAMNNIFDFAADSTNICSCNKYSNQEQALLAMKCNCKIKLNCKKLDQQLKMPLAYIWKTLWMFVYMICGKENSEAVRWLCSELLLKILKIATIKCVFKKKMLEKLYVKIPNSQS